ncbi:related to dna mismatch repair homologue (hpms2) [Rhynchosporium secalis]|uniref:Related to dna mismatch repair homologue (Hpms2) n=1 Tax=Rhynchosporium secalis TaxID=38038 RepID=A0A1E1M734_RHYSE|nr:related to dna mismatch repair homologue (hpms2) [Rhynchosporium secalis]
MSIQPLPLDVVAQIKSSITITSLNGVIGELIKNSLDADSTKIDISVDYGRGSCSVEDNGLGILPSEFGVNGHLGKLHRQLNHVFSDFKTDEVVDTSKLNAQTELHGGRGIFLASLSAMALVSITSRHNLHRSHNALTLHKSVVASRHAPAPPQQHLTSNHGTRVTVRDLFGNMPVRVKQRAIVAEKERGNSKDWEVLKRDVIALLLPWNNMVAIALRDSQSAQKMNIRPPSMPFQSGKLSVSSVCSILHQASFIDYREKISWISVNASTPSLEVSGAISLVPIATKNVQFMSIGIQPLNPTHRKSIFQDEINRLFTNSAFGIEEQPEEIDNTKLDRRAKYGRYKGEGYTGKELKAVKKGVDRWPMFFIKIQSSDLGKAKLEAEDAMDENSQDLLRIMEVLRAMILEFLTKNHFRPKSARCYRSRPELDAGLQKNAGSGPASMSSQPFRSTDTFRSKGNKSTLKNKSQLDLLGTNIRLPSFRQGVISTDRTFDSWARVKSGTVSRSITLKPAIAVNGDHDNYRASTASHSLTNLLRDGHSSPRGVLSEPLLFRDGNIVRAPFGDVTARAKHLHPIATPQNPAVSNSPAVSDQDMTLEHGDDVVAWVNPITKVRSLVNQRTGLTVKATNASTHPGPRPRLTTPYPSQTALPFVPSPWISDMLKTWDNPIFAPAEPSIPQVSFDGLDATTRTILHGRHHHCSQIDIDRAFEQSSSGIHGSISKSALGNAEVISQVDQKFILVKLQSGDVLAGKNDGSMLVLIDQHAADERIRVEALMEELCRPHSGAGIESGVFTSSLAKPLHFDLSAMEVNLLDIHKTHFANWGILYNQLPTAVASVQRLIVQSLPPSILERCQSSPRLLIDLIRTELHVIQAKHGTPLPPLPSNKNQKSDWIRRIHTCPQGLLDMINSRACRSAIMFNDVLTKGQCEVLVKRLATCIFPFQCAHGRPSLIPLLGLGCLRVGAWYGDGTGDGFGCGGEEERGFRGSFAAWKEGMRRV